MHHYAVGRDYMQVYKKHLFGEINKTSPRRTPVPPGAE